MTRFIAQLYNLLLHFTHHSMTHHFFSVIFDCNLKRIPQLRFQSQSCFTIGGLPPISSCWRQAPLDSDQQLFFKLNPCCYSPSVTSSLTRGWVCRLQLLLALARTVILGPESRGTHDHSFLSQIRDSPNLVGQFSVFISPRNRVDQFYLQALGSFSSFFFPSMIPAAWVPRYIDSGRIHRKHRFLRYPNNTAIGSRGVPSSPLRRNGSSSLVACVFVAAGMCLLSRCLAIDVCSGPTIPASRRHVTISSWNSI
jgi:hypothetical protein